MKRIMLSTKIACGAFILAAATFASCSDSVVGGAEDTTDGATDGASRLTTVQLATFAGDQSRVTYAAATRADVEKATPTLELVAEIDNPSKKEGFDLVQNEGRYLSATSIYYDDKNDKYYITYHMQGNNYNTELANEIGGAIQVFDIETVTTTEGSEVKVNLGQGFRAEDPKKEDFDFNHIYFDRTDNRILAVGHKWSVPTSWTSDEDYTGKRENTRAIIGVFDPESAKFNYSTINTGEKEYKEGKSQGYIDAGDANCVIRAGETQNRNHTYGWNFYHVATRKGMAVLSAEADHLFEPITNEDGTNYFIKTPGSAKFLSKTGTSSWFDLLYLTEDKENESYTTSSKAKIAHFSTQTKGENSTLGYLRRLNVDEAFDPQQDDIIDYEDQTDITAEISPIDGKNTLLTAPDCYSDKESYVALGTGGMYYKFNGVNSGKDISGVLKFKSTNGYLPVNCVTVDVSDQESGHDGFIYVACGARLVILHRKTFEVVAHWNIPTKDEAGELTTDVNASANYIHVEKGPVKKDAEGKWEPRERTITVAFGQAGVKVFKFNPATLEKKTVWEKEELPLEI